MRQLCGLATAVLAAIVAIGFSAPIASAATIPVINGGFETEFGTNTDPTLNWAKIPSAPWSFENGNTALRPIAGNFSSAPNGGSNFTRFTWNNAGFEQNLQTAVSAGDTLSVTFNLGVSLGAWDQNASRVKGNAYFKVGSTRYNMPYDLTGQTVGVWYPFTFTTTITNSGNLSIGFQNLGVDNTYYTSLDGVSDVTLTPASNDQNAPTSTNATLAADENVATALAASNFGYADPNSSPLSNVQITAVPTLGTLTYNGSPVANNDIIAAANIGNLSYRSPLGGFGSPYTTIGIKVQNSALPTGLWSLPATMTVNVTDVNHPPTSTGGSVILRKNTVKTFAAADFPFSDIDAGSTLQAIKVTSLPNPTNGTLTLSASPVTLDQVIAVADITAGNLTYTPNADYTGSDPFNFQVRDAALFSADATMAITVTPDIIVQNPSFETIGGSLGGPWARAAAVWNANLDYAQTNDNARFATRTDAGIWYANLTDPGNTFYQNLGVSVNSGDTLAVTFYAGRENGRVGGVMAATFLVDGTPYTETFDTTGLTPGTWQSYTLTKTIANSGALTLRFSNVSDRPWLDNISNISVTTGGGPTPGSFADWALTNAPGQDPSQDKNNDGVQNGVAYFMGVTGLATNPGPDASNTVTWPMSATYQGTFVVQTSTDLGTWTPADPQPTPSGGNLTYTLPPNAPGGKSFVRLLVTPN